MCVTGMETTHNNELHLAVETANFRRAEDLLTQGTACIDECNTAGNTPLMLTLGREISLRMAKLLLRFGASINKVSTVHGHSALSMCVDFGDMSKVAFLVSGGADVNGLVRGCVTPLYIATRRGNTEVMKYLLLHGADPLIPAGARQEKDPVVLDIAAEVGKVDVVRTLFKYGKGLDGSGGFHRGTRALGIAVVAGNLEVVRALSEEGVRDDGVALHLALRKPDCSILEHLLRIWETSSHSMDGRYMLKRDPQGDSVLMVAVAHAKYPSACRRARFLLEAGAIADCGRFCMETGATVASVTAEEGAMQRLVAEKVLNYKRDSSEDFTGERLAAIGRLLRQAGAIHARSWLWSSPGGGETARKKSKGGASEGFAIMLKNMKRRAVVNVASNVLRIHECRVAVEQAIRTGDLPPGCASLAYRRL